MNVDRYSDFGFNFSLSLFPMSFGIPVAFSFLLWSFSRHFSMIVEMYVDSFVFLFISFLCRFKTRRESFVSSSGISFNSFSSSSFFLLPSLFCQTTNFFPVWNMCLPTKFSTLPVDDWILFLQPRKTQNDFLFSKASKEEWLGLRSSIDCKC